MRISFHCYNFSACVFSYIWAGCSQICQE
jgi:hypothetical protein